MCEMITRRNLVSRMFGTMLSGQETREPTATDWDVAGKISNVLEVPCKTVIKAQDKGHWLLVDATNRVCRIFAELRHATALLPRRISEPGLTSLKRDMLKLDHLMSSTIVQHLCPR